VAERVVKVSDLTGKDIPEGQESRLVVRRHPAFQQSITLDVAPSDVEGLKELDQVIEVEFRPAGDEKPRTLLVELEAFNSLADDMNTVLINAVAALAPPAAEPRRRGRPSGAGGQRARVNYASLEHAGEPHRGRITDAEKDLVRTNLDKINKRLRDSGLREIDPSDPTMKERYGL
jgi:hypothetical protein